MVINNSDIKSKSRFQFSWENDTKDVITKYNKKTIRNTINTKRVCENFDTFPVGCCREFIEKCSNIFLNLSKIKNKL